MYIDPNYDPNIILSIDNTNENNNISQSFTITPIMIIMIIVFVMIIVVIQHPNANIHHFIKKYQRNHQHLINCLVLEILHLIMTLIQINDIF